MSSEINLSDNDVVETHDPHHTQDATHIRKQIALIENEMVNLDLGSSSQTDHEQNELGSDQVLEHFQSHQGEDGAICKYCMKKLVGSVIGTKHLRNHFERCAKKANIGGRDGDHKPADLGNWLRNPLPVRQNPLVDPRMTIKNGDMLLLNSIKPDHIIQLYKEEKESLGTYLKNLSCCFCLSIHKYEKYFWFLVHFIDDDWDTKEKIISLRKIEEDSNMLKCLKDVLLEWGINKNISSIIVLHGYEDDAFDLAAYVTSCNEISSWFNYRCSLPLAGNLLCISLNYLTRVYYDLVHDLLNNVLNKIYEIFAYVRKTSSNEQSFQIAIERAKSLGKEVTAQVIPVEEMHWVEWSITKCLEHALGYKEAFFELENIDTEFKLINLTKEGWGQVLVLNNCCEELFDKFGDGHRRCPTANTGFVLLCQLYTRSLLLLNLYLFYGDNQEIFYRFRNIMDEYWSRNNSVLAVAAVLDPRFKLDIVEYWYKKIYGSEWEIALALFEDYLTDVYREYARLDSSGKQLYGSLISNMVLHPPRSELDLYLKEVEFPLLGQFNILNWWRVGELNFPTLALMARDFLSIKVSCYSYHHLREAAERHSYSDMAKEAFICTKNWLKTR